MKFSFHTDPFIEYLEIHLESLKSEIIFLHSCNIGYAYLPSLTSAMEITCYRDSEISREARHLPASTYNLAITLLSRCTTKYLFVPIRSMQYMAIMDNEEFVFIDGERRCWIDIAW